MLAFLAVVSLRWTATAAQAGPKSLLLWIMAACFFMVPEIVAVVHLSRSLGNKDGLYGWVRDRLGRFHGFLCGWCYWVNNLIYFPTLLLFMTANVAMALGTVEPQGSQVVFLTLVALWVMAGLSILGTRISRGVQTLGIIGNWTPLVILIALAGCLFVRTGIEWRDILYPKGLAASTDNLSLFSSLCFALAGFELVSFYREGAPGRRGFLWAAGLLAILAYLAGTLAILVGARSRAITNLNGIVLAISDAASTLGLAWIVMPVGLLMALAVFAGTFVWFRGAAEIPYLVGVDRYLPPSFSKRSSRFGTPTVAILSQAGIASLFTVMASSGEQLERAYRTLGDICLIVYFIPYIYLFLTHWIVIRNTKAVRQFPVPLLGLFSTVLAIWMALFPAGATASAIAPRTLLGSGALITVGVIIYFFNQIRTRSHDSDH